MLKILLRDLRSNGIIVAAKTKKLPSIPFLSTYSAFMIISLFNDYKDGDNMPLWDWDLIRKNHLPDKENVLCVYTYHGGFRKISPAVPQLWTKEKPSHLCHLCISHVSLITINITSSFNGLNSYSTLSLIFLQHSLSAESPGNWPDDSLPPFSVPAIIYNNLRLTAAEP